MTQLCFSRKIANCPRRFSLVAFGVRKRIRMPASRDTAATRTTKTLARSGNAAPVGYQEGRIASAAPANPSSSSQSIFATASGVAPARCDCGRLFMKKKARHHASTTRTGTQTSPQFWIHTCAAAQLHRHRLAAAAQSAEQRRTS